MHLLPPELLLALEDVGAVKYDLPDIPELPNQRFSVTAVLDRGLRIELDTFRFDEEGLFAPPSGALWPAA